MNPRGLSFELLLAATEEFCSHRPCRIRSIPALAALAGASSITLAGVSYYASADACAKELRALCEKLAPLDSRNPEFAEFLHELILRWNSE